MSVTLYILEFILCSAIFVALYKLFIEARVSHRYSRIYLVWSMIFSAVVPLLELPLYPAQTIYYELPIITYEQPEILPTPEPMPAVDATPDATPQPKPTDWARVAAIVAASIYGLILLLNLARFAWRLWIIRKLRRRCELTIYEAYTLAMSDQISEPFSFWRTIYMNRHFQGREQQQIITHELSHVRHHHTAERLALELMRCLFWFNPFVWISGTLLVQVQEWQADRDVIDAGYDVYEYRQSIFRQLYGIDPDFDLANGIYRNLTKKRFLMMTNNNKGRFSFLRMCAVVPLMVAMFLAFVAVRAEDKIVYTSSSQQAELNPQSDPIMNVNTTGQPMTTTEESTAEKSLVVPTALHQIGNPVLISADGTISYKGKVVTLQELELQLAADSSEIDILTISADSEARVGVLDDVKLAARNSRVLKVNMVSSAGKGVYMVLPPPAGDPNAPVKVTFTTDTKVTKTDFNELRVKKNNLLCVYVNSLGKIMTTRPDGKDGVVGLDELKDIVRQFVDNTEWVDGKLKQKNPNYSSFRLENFKLGDGTFRHSTSDGIVSIHTTRDLSVQNYLSVQTAIREAFAELREELAQQHFNRSFESLSKIERDFVTLVIPVKVSNADPDIK